MLMQQRGLLLLRKNRRIVRLACAIVCLRAGENLASACALVHWSERDNHPNTNYVVAPLISSPTLAASCSC